ncbi:MAG: DNA polymerase I [Planctomycetales bacterium]|nr:DNA polymerase I [Planctomycetales bacterium]
MEDLPERRAQKSGDIPAKAPAVDVENVADDQSSESVTAAAAEAVAGDAPADSVANSPEGKTAYILDTHSLIFQIFHALPEMTSPTGEGVGVVYGIVRDIFYLLEEKKPDYLFAAFDRPGPTFRHEVFEAYKADRGEMPDELKPQIPKVREALESMGVPVIDYEGFEADDVLATFARLCNEQGVHCRLVTADKDCRQLITPLVRLYNVRKNTLYDETNLEKDWGIRPDQVVDFQSLVGDPTDGVPGVALIGPKIAQSLLAEFETLEGVLAAAPTMKKGKRRDNLVDGREIAMMCRRLVELDQHVPVEFDWNAGRAGQLNLPKLAELFARYGFRGYSEKVAQLSGGSKQIEWKADYQLVDTPAKLAALVKHLEQQREVSVDTETTSVSPRFAELVGISLAWREGEAYYLPVRAPDGEHCLELQPTLAALRPFFADQEIAKVGQNLKYDLIVLRGAGVEVRGVGFDTMVASYLLEAGERNHNLNDLSRRHLNHSPIPISDLIGKGKNQKRMDEVPLDDICEYAAEDADLALRLMPILRSAMDDAELDELFANVEMPLVEVLAKLEFTGIRVDVDHLRSLSARYQTKLEELEVEIFRLAGHEFNIASRNQLAQVLFEELGLPVVKKTKTGPSTDSDVLTQLAPQHPLPAKIIEQRQFAKLKSTYVDALPELVHPSTGRIHASFNQVVAATGRLSSSDPNLQNIPVRTEEGREIRAAFVPESGWRLLAADYSQVELRMLAHYSEDAALCAAFEADEDIHRRVASEVYNVPPSEVDSAMRRAAKAVNFGIIYGQSAYGLSAALGISQEDAAEFIDSYFTRYETVEKFLERTLESCRQNGYVRTILGRRRAIRGVRAGASRQRNLPERTAINTVIQGSAADLIKLAMLAIDRRLDREGFRARMLLQIHDELIFEVPPEELDALGALVSAEMSQVLALRVPLKVDLKSGLNWADCEPWNS